MASDADQVRAAVEIELGEIVPLNQPDNIPSDVWALIQDNGRVATERLSELLNSQRFHRLKASDQAKLIQLAQDRAFGRPDPGVKRTIKTVSHEIHDATAHSLRNLQTRLTLPEYSRARRTDDAPDLPLSLFGQDDASDPDRPSAAKIEVESFNRKKPEVE